MDVHCLLLILGRVAVTASTVGHSRHPSTWQHSPAPPEGSGSLTGQMRYMIPPASSGSTLGSPRSWRCPENLPRKPPKGGILTRCLNHLCWLLLVQRSSGSTPSSLQSSQLLTPFLRLSPATHRENSFQPLESAISSFQSRPTARDHRWRLEHTWTGKSSFAFQLSSFFTTTVQHNACITTDTAPSRLSIFHSCF